MNTKPLAQSQIKRIIDSSNPLSLLEKYHAEGFWIEDFLLDVLNGVLPCPKHLVFEDVSYGKTKLKAISLSNATLFFSQLSDGTYVLWP